MRLSQILWKEKGTDSPFFKRWFGDSKVVDEDGKPLAVYHGTYNKFTLPFHSLPIKAPKRLKLA